MSVSEQFAFSLSTELKMATAEEIMQTVNPIKSSKSYDNQWDDFINFCGISEEPNEEDFIKYFHHLGEVRKYASSSLWSKYSMINHKYQTLHGHKLQKFPRVTLLLKKFEAGYKRKKASIFTKDHIMQFLNDAPDDGEYVHIKAGVVVAYFGGLRCADLVGINCEDLEFNENTGMWVTYTISKQRGESINNKFNIPLQFCSYLETYDNALHRCNAGSGRFMKTYRVNKNCEGFYTRQPMGKNFLAKFTVKMANFLNLPNPETYSGHAIRRSSASIMAEAGTSTSQLKKHFYWKTEATSLKYIENSEK